MNLILSDCLIALKNMPANSVESLITDPPAGISFMGKDWDSSKGGRDSWIAWMTEVMVECHRVMKPGAHGLVWAIPRTSHWTATALENAGFEVRDVVTHLFGSGFPKSLDISKAIDKAAGAERKSTGRITSVEGARPNGSPTLDPTGKMGRPTEEKTVNYETLPATSEAKQWQGWGTALKPASEHWILVRKPLAEKTVAANVLKHGVGGINIDGCRVNSGPSSSVDRRKNAAPKESVGATGWTTPARPISYNEQKPGEQLGRFPANLLLSHTLFCDTECTEDCPVRLLDEQSGVSQSTKITRRSGNREQAFGMGDQIGNFGFSDTGGASRFFYVAKASKRERGEGNVHPTVKSLKLMQYLITLITPPGGKVLDPFMGSGSTGVAAKKLGYGFIGIEREKEYFDIAEKRVTA